VLYGSPAGLSATAVLPDQFWTEDSPDVEGIADGPDYNRSDNFGWTLAAGDLNHDGYSDLAIGVPGKDVSRDDAGAVNVLYGSAAGLSPTAAMADQYWTQDSTGIEESSGFDDHFGTSVTTGDFNSDGYVDLAVGVPGEDLSTNFSLFNAGAVNVIYGSSSGLSATGSSGTGRTDQLWSQNTPNVEGTAEGNN